MQDQEKEKFTIAEAILSNKDLTSGKILLLIALLGFGGGGSLLTWLYTNSGYHAVTELEWQTLINSVEKMEESTDKIKLSVGKLTIDMYECEKQLDKVDKHIESP